MSSDPTNETEPFVDLGRLCDRSAVLSLLRPAIFALADGPLKFNRFDKDIALWAQDTADPARMARALEILDVTVAAPAGVTELFSSEGALIVVSNHPFGALEMLCLGAVLERQRPGFRLVATDYLNRIGPIATRLIAVDSFGRWDPNRRNVAPLRQARQHLAEGGALLIYPAGRVSHFRLSHMSVTDPDWTAHVIRLARATGARLLPVYFPGRNSLLFNAAGLVHPLFRTLLLVRELYRRSGDVIRFDVGDPLDPEALCDLDDQAAIELLRKRVYSLGRPARA
ncbi:hypothetical protein GCM10023209_04740 [Roseibacterium beibuensis]|uniref:Phospholipid/glycerol acyltransferase domain-containing protein n=2 Tax=[Roseibacterium] beibuensis TaxID=1193142 RepID=A0ABP9KUK4_9RHOB